VIHAFCRGGREGGRFWRTAAVACLSFAAALAAAAGPEELRERHGALREGLRSNPYHRPIHIDSAESADTLKGDVYAVLDHPFEAMSGAFKDSAEWCAVLILPFNTKYCHATSGPGGPGLDMRIGRKAEQAVADAYRLDFHLRPVAARPDYFESQLLSESGPMGTRDYRIVLSAIPLDAYRTFMHLSYSYVYSGMGRMATQVYLSTTGAQKVGFTVVGRDGNDQPVYVQGVRGIIERNVMRYYLAIDAHLASLGVPPDQRLDKRIQTWFNSTEQYARQLHEMDRAQYLAMKRGEYERQQALLE
jgi:hypothetical protein